MASTALDSRERAFERLYRRHAVDVYRFALTVCRNPAEAEDVTQTTFLNAYRALKRGDRPERPHSWLIAIAHNAIRSRHRWTLRRPKEVPLEAAAYQLAAPVEERSGVRDVLAALGELPVNQRAALTMRELEGRSYPEIAETLGVSVPAVESLISRARRTLRSRRAALRGLILLQLPRSLRGLLEQGDGVSGGLLPKAAALVAGVGLVTAGIGVGTHHTRAPQAEAG
ncbi:MAG TPA: RNA polymerase sigma factor, partial [Gaiellaceae bacterium]